MNRLGICDSRFAWIRVQICAIPSYCGQENANLHHESMIHTNLESQLNPKSGHLYLSTTVWLMVVNTSYHNYLTQWCIYQEHEEPDQRLRGPAQEVRVRTQREHQARPISPSGRLSALAPTWRDLCQTRCRNLELGGSRSPWSHDDGTRWLHNFTDTEGTWT